MRNSILLRTLLVLFACLSIHTLQAQFDEFDEFEEYDDTYQKSYAERLQEFDNNLREARDYFQNQDDQARIARTHKKIDQGLQGFLETEFMTKFKDMRLEMESLAASFKAYSETLKPEEVIRVKKAYVKVSDNCNELLHDIKRDFLDGKKLKHIRKYPEMYSASLELKLRELQDDYSRDFQKVIADITGSDQYSAGPFMAIFGIIQFAVDFTNYLARVRYDNRRVKEEHLEMYFIEPYRFRSWDEIEIISANIYGNDADAPMDEGYDNYDYEENNEVPQNGGKEEINPFEEEGVESLKPKKKKRKNNNN